jgi:hypothetical protein
VAEYRSGPSSAEQMMVRDQLSEQVTTLFLQHDEFAATVHDFYSYVGQVVARHPAFLSTSHPTPCGQESRVLLIAKRFRS